MRLEIPESEYCKHILGIAVIIILFMITLMFIPSALAAAREAALAEGKTRDNTSQTNINIKHTN